MAFLSLVAFEGFGLEASAQDRPTVGVVLSGGGARGAAHVGFFRALEEAGIQVDYIVGSSTGALVGAYYAAGWTPEEMTKVVESRDFSDRLKGRHAHSLLFKNDQVSPVLFDIRFSGNDGRFRSNLVSSLPLEWSLLEELGPAEALCRNDFDQLLIPFRCVGSDVLAKKDTVFRSGSLVRSVRASISFPFYLPPVWMDGRPFYDGGLYNNVPLDVMMQEFDPDIILVSAIQSGTVDFESDDLLSQLEALIVRDQLEMNEAKNVWVIQPDLPVGTFDFEGMSHAIQVGFDDSDKYLKNSGLDSIGSSELFNGWNEIRRRFREDLPPFSIDSCRVSGLEPSQTAYAERFLVGGLDDGRTQALKRNLFLLDSDDHIGRITPQTHWDSLTGMFDLQLDVQTERELFFEVGGSLPSNTSGFGFASLSYNRFSRIPLKIEGALARGPFYNSTHADLRFDFHQRLPFAIDLFFSNNQFNFRRSSSTFFEDIQPIFLTSRERETGVVISTPAGSNGVLKGKFTDLWTQDQSYGDWLFDPIDTADVEDFRGRVGELQWMFEDRDDVQFPTSGGFANIRIQRFHGESSAVIADAQNLGSRDSLQRSHEFFRFRAIGESRFGFWNRRLVLGLRGELCLSDERLRSTYRASLAQAVGFQPMLGSKVLFLDSFRAYNFIALGTSLDVSLSPNLMLKLEAHGFQALEGIYDAEKGPGFRSQTPARWMSGLHLVSKLPIGPISVGLEYYEKERTPWIFEVHWGYRLFRGSSRR